MASCLFLSFLLISYAFEKMHLEQMLLNHLSDGVLRNSLKLLYFFLLSLADISPVLISFIGPVILYLFAREDTLSRNISNVRPLWRIISFNKSIEFFTTGTQETVVDNIRYYYLIFKGDRLKSVNQTTKDPDNEFEDFFPNENAIAKSSVELYLSEFNKKEKIADASESVFSHRAENETDLFVIKSTTIYGEDTSFFEGKGLHGGIYSDKGTYKAYSGNMFDKRNITKAQDYLCAISQHHFKSNKSTSDTSSETTIRQN